MNKSYFIVYSHTWMESNDKFFLIKKSMPNLKINKKNSLFNMFFPLWLNFPLVIDLFDFLYKIIIFTQKQGLKIEKLDGENQKCLITVIIQSKNFNFFKQKIVNKFILSLMINYTAIKWDFSDVIYTLMNIYSYIISRF